MAAASLADPVAGGPPQKTRLSNQTFLGFSLGMIGERIFRDAPALLLLLFMTDYLAIPAAMAGAAVFIPKILIVFVDPLVGALSDRIRTPWGRRRPLMFAGAILASASLVMFFRVPHFDQPIVQAAYMSLIILIGFCGYSLFSVPYLTMASEMADSDEQRRMIMSWRIVFMAIGLSASAYAGGFMQWVGGGMAGYRTMSWVYGAICLVTMMITVAAAKEKPAEQAAGLSLGWMDQARLVAANKPFCRLLLVCFLQKAGEGIGYGSFAYFCIYVVKQPLSAIGMVVLAGVAGQILAQPLWLRASKRWSGPTLYTVGVLGWCLNLILWLAMKGQSTLWLIPLGLESGVAAGGFLMVTLALLSNTLAADARDTGVNREGVYSGAWLATEKLAFAFGALIVGSVLSAFGFVESANGGHVVQSARAVFGIGFAYCGVNMLIYLASILAIRRFAAKGAPFVATA